MSLPGKQLERCLAVILDAIRKPAELRQLIRMDLDLDPSEISFDIPYRDAVFEFLSQMDAECRLPDLFRVLRKARPKHPGIIEMEQLLATGTDGVPGDSLPGESIPPQEGPSASRVRNGSGGSRRRRNAFRAKDLHSALTRPLDGRAPGLMDCAYRSVARGKLYVAPTVRMPSSGTTEVLDDHVDRFLTRLRDPSASDDWDWRILAITAGPGMGKTIALLRVLDRIASNPCKGQLFAIYIPFRGLAQRDCPAFDEGWLAKYVQEHYRISPDDAQALVSSRRVLLLLDGVDELFAGSEANKALTRRFLRSELLAFPTIMACRKDEFEQELMHLIRRPLAQVELEGWNDAARLDLVDRLGKRLRLDSDTRSRIEVLIQREELKQLARVPLLVVMLTQSIVRLVSDLDDSAVRSLTRSRIFAEAIRGWFDCYNVHDAEGKGGNDIPPRLLLQVAKRVAFAMFRGGKKGLGFSVTRQKLNGVIERELNPRDDLTVGKIIQALVHSSVLRQDNGDRFSFGHANFQEFLIAWCLVEELAKTKNGARCLCRPLPTEIASFVQDIITDADEVWGINAVDLASNLQWIYFDFRSGESFEITNARMQAAFYLAGLERAGAGLAFIARNLDGETDPVVLRAMVVGASLLGHDRSKAEYYVRLLRSKDGSKHVETHLGYLLYYYGDKPLSDRFEVREGDQCERTLRRLLQHLRDPAHYGDVLLLDLCTIALLLDRLGESRICTPDLAGDFIEVLSQIEADDPEVRAERDSLMHRFRVLSER